MTKSDVAPEPSTRQDVKMLHEQYRRALVSAGCMVFWLNARGRVVRADGETTNLTGYNAASLDGMLFTALVRPDWYERVLNLLIPDSTDRRAGQDMTFPLITRHGNEREVRLFVLPASAAHKEPQETQCAVLCPVADVPAPAAAEREALNASFEGLLLHDGTHIVDVNASFEAMLNYPRDTVIGQPVDLCLPQAVNPGLLERLANGTNEPAQAVAVCANGDYLPVEARARTLQYGGQAVQVIALRDIGERLHAERHLRAHDDLYRQLARSLPDTAVLIFDQDCRHMLAEGDLIQQEAFNAAEMLTRTPAETSLEPGQAEVMVNLYRRALAGEIVHDQMALWDRYFDLQVLPVYDADGSVTRGMVVVQETTEQKHTEHALGESETRLRGLFEHNNDAVFFIDLDNTIIDANQQAQDMLGVSRAALIGEDADVYVTGEPAMESERIREHLLRGEQQPLYVRTFRRADGSTFPAEVNVALVSDREGRPLHYQSIVRDISARAHVEAQLARRVDQLSTLRMFDEELADRLDVDYVVTMGLDAALRLSVADAGFIALYDSNGLLEPAAITGDYPQDMTLPFSPGKSVVLSRVLNTHEAVFVPDVHQDADYVPLRERTAAQIILPLLSPDRLVGVLNLECNKLGRFDDEVFDLVKLLAGRISVAIDNARLYRQTNEQLVQLKDLYEQVSALEQVKTDMIRVAAHDLRNPLAAIVSYSEVLLEDLEALTEPGELPLQVNNIRQAANRMRRIIEEILSLDRIEQTVQKTEYPHINLVDVVTRVYRDNLTVAEQLERRLVLDVTQDVVGVRADQVEMEEVLNNLIDNALKYTPQSGTVQVNLEPQGRHAVLTVTDDGYGIPADKQDRLFQPFYRVRTVETDDVKGTGLGLHLVKNIVERHGGVMVFRSTYGEGSTFGFRLPLVDEDDA